MDNVGIDMSGVRNTGELMGEGTVGPVTEVLARAAGTMGYREITGRNAWEIAIRFRVYEWLYGAFLEQEDHESDAPAERPIVLNDVVRHIGLSLEGPRGMSTLDFYRRSVLPRLGEISLQGETCGDVDEYEAVTAGLQAAASVIGFACVCSPEDDAEAFDSLFARIVLYEALFGAFTAWRDGKGNLDERPVTRMDLVERAGMPTTAACKSDPVFFEGTVHRRLLMEMKAEQESAGRGNPSFEEAEGKKCGACRGLGVDREGNQCRACEGSGMIGGEDAEA